MALVTEKKDTKWIKIDLQKSKKVSSINDNNSLFKPNRLVKNTKPKWLKVKLPTGEAFKKVEA